MMCLSPTASTPPTSSSTFSPAGAIPARRSPSSRRPRSLDTDALSRDRDQLFAEAVRLYREGRPWWPDDRFEQEHVKPQQEARFDADVWEEIVGPWVLGRSRVSVAEVARDCLHIETPRINTTAAVNIPRNSSFDSAPLIVIDLFI
jgi:predicted P-loop ATPase